MALIRSTYTRLFGGALLLYCLSTPAALAHVKWFADYDLNQPPRPILNVIFNSHFLVVAFLCTLILFAAAYIDRLICLQGPAMTKRISAISNQAAPFMPILLRAGVGVFLCATAYMGNTLLTPEFKTTWTWVPWFQVFLSACLFTRRTSAICGLGIISLFTITVVKFGFYHAADYPIFLGIAVYLLLHAVYGDKTLQLATNILRVSTGLTLLWASVEKWAFPQWSFKILHQHPALSMGIGDELYMLLAGFVEFCAAFLLITGKQSARVAALILLFFFISAIPPFGLIDAIGHSGIIVVLIMLLFDDNPVAQFFDFKKSLNQTALLHSFWFITALTYFCFVYYTGYFIEY